MTPLPSVYKGYQCRSRLEARWLCFLDTLGMQFIYEPEGFKFEDGTCYLPDLYFPEIRTWAEIKPFIPDDWSPEIHKLRQLVIESQRPALLLDAQPDARHYWKFYIGDDRRIHRAMVSIDTKGNAVHRLLGMYSPAYRRAVIAARALRFDTH